VIFQPKCGVLSLYIFQPVWPGKERFCEKLVARPAGNAVVTCY